LNKGRLDLIGGDIGVLELNLPDRAAGVVDGELEARLAVGERRKQDEDQARNDQQTRE
jgi:hypothetical protein